MSKVEISLELFRNLYENTNSCLLLARYEQNDYMIKELQIDVDECQKVEQSLAEKGIMLYEDDCPR